MIRNVVIHFEGELPVVADLRALPGPTDISLLCTNMRTIDGKRPTFIDQTKSWFLIPVSVVRFIEMPSDALEMTAEGPDVRPAASEEDREALPALEASLDVEPDESLLQRIRDI